MNPREQTSQRRTRTPRAPSVDSLRERLLALPGDEHDAQEAEQEAPEHEAPEPTRGSTFVDRIDARPALVKDEFVLAAADPMDPAEREAARAERRRRRALRQAAAKRRRRRNRFLATMAVVLTVTLAFTGWLRWTTGGIDRIPGALNGGSDTPGTTILLVGSDPSAHDEVTGSVTWKRDLTHSDLVMLVHLPEDGGSMYGISLPGRLLLDLPDGSRGHVGEAMAAGGQAAYVDTVERATGVHVDHLASLNMAGLHDIIDELGGITAHVATAGCGEQPGTWKLDGQAALELIRYRPCLPNGDLDRVARQQSVLKGLLASLVDGGALPNPFKLNAVAKDTFDHLAVDEGWGLLSMAGTAWSQRRVTPRTTTFLTVPTTRQKGRLTIAGGRAAELWQAVRDDRMADFVALNRELVD